MICVVLLAVVMGIFYYYYQARVDSTISDGTLVMTTIPGVASLWQ